MISSDNANFGKFTLESSAVSGFGPAHSVDVDIATALTAAGASLGDLTPERFAAEIEKQLNTAAWASATTAQQTAGSGAVSDYYFPYSVVYARGEKGFKMTLVR